MYMKAATYCKTYSAIELARNKQRHMLVLKFQPSHKLAHKRAAKCIRSTSAFGQKTLILSAIITLNAHMKCE